MLPFVGSLYKRMNNRVLIIGESHYLSSNSIISGNKDRRVTQWYNGRVEDLSTEEQAWINTRLTAGGDSKPKGHAIYRQLKHALRELLGEDAVFEDNPFRAIAFYNYFQRPAQTGESLVLTEQDKNVACKHLLELVNILGVTHLAFVSKLAFNCFWRRVELEKIEVPDYFGTAHPGCSWWNREHRHWYGDDMERMTSREWFLKQVGKLSIKGLLKNKLSI
jgi:hypothetical protein